MSPRLGEVVLSTQSDERLVRLARAGHERAFAVIVERYRPELYALARRLSPDGKGEDIVQQAFLSAFAALRSGAEVGHLRGWLYRIVRNAAAASYAPLCMPLDGGAASDESVEDVVQQRAVAMNALAELARLPKRQRQAMVGTALDGRGRAEVASSMGVSEGAVRQLVHRARATLRTAVTAVTPWPLARLLASAGPGGGRTAELAGGVGAGAASSGGVALKLGIVLASGAIATGVAAVGIHRGEGQAHRATLGATTRSVHAQTARGRDHLVTVAMLAQDPAVIQGAVSEQSRPAGATRAAVGVQGRVGAVGATEPHGQGGGTDSHRGGSGRRDAGRSGLGAGVGLRGGRGWGSGVGSRAAGGSGWSDGGGSERGEYGGSGFGDGGGYRGGGGSRYAGGSGPSDGGGLSGSGSRWADGGGGGGVRGADGASLAGPQAVVANDSFGSAGGGSRGGSPSGGYGSGYGGSGWSSGPVGGSGTGAGGSATGAGGWGSGSGSVGGVSGSGVVGPASGAVGSVAGAVGSTTGAAGWGS